MFHSILLQCDALDHGAHVRERLTENRFDLTLQGGPNQHGTHRSRRTTRTNCDTLGVCTRKLHLFPMLHV